PPALFEAYSVKEQKDASIRFLLDWKHQTGTTSKHYVKAAYFRDALQYADSAIHLYSDAFTNHFYAEGGWEKASGRSNLLLFVPVQLITISTTGNRQVRAALAGAYSVKEMQGKLQM